MLGLNARWKGFYKAVGEKKMKPKELLKIICFVPILGMTMLAIIPLYVIVRMFDLAEEFVKKRR